MTSELYERMCGRVHRKYALYCLLQMTKHKIYELTLPNDCIRKYLGILRIEKNRSERILQDFSWIFNDRVTLDMDGNKLNNIVLWIPGYYGNGGHYEKHGWNKRKVNENDKIFYVNEKTVTVMLDLMEEHGF